MAFRSRPPWLPADFSKLANYPEAKLPINPNFLLRDLHETMLDELCRSRHRIRIDLDIRKRWNAQRGRHRAEPDGLQLWQRLQRSDPYRGRPKPGLNAHGHGDRCRLLGIPAGQKTAFAYPSHRRSMASHDEIRLVFPGPSLYRKSGYRPRSQRTACRPTPVAIPFSTAEIRTDCLSFAWARHSNLANASPPRACAHKCSRCHDD